MGGGLARWLATEFDSARCEVAFPGRDGQRKVRGRTFGSRVLRFLMGLTIFAVLLPEPQPALAKRIRDEFGEDALSVTETQWLVAASGTSEDLVRRLGIFDRANPSAPAVGSAIVFATSGYFGRAPTNIWEWLKTKLEGVSSVPSAKSA